jgi:hypothetical protein
VITSLSREKARSGTITELEFLLSSANDVLIVMPAPAALDAAMRADTENSALVTVAMLFPILNLVFLLIQD